MADEDILSLVKGSCDGCEIVEQVSDGWAMLRAVELYFPDLILADLDMPGLDGIEATARLNHIHPDIRVIILASSDAHELIEEAFEAGGRAYVLKSELARDLMPAVAAVMAESRFISESAC